MKEFFGFGGYQRTPEGYMSWQHLLFVTSLLIVMAAAAWLLGRKHRLSDDRAKNKVLIWSAFLIDGIELFKIVMLCIRGKDPMGWLYNLPLFLCSIQLIAIPMAAFCKGRIREASLDFVFIFGLLGAVLGTYGAGQNYNAYPVLGLDNVASGLTHSISGFCSLYIAFSGLVSMKKNNIGICFGILLGFCVLAYATNHLADYNYMFLMAGNGTPYDILYNLVGGSPIFYPIGVVVLFLLYISGFYYIYYLTTRKKAAAK